MGFGTVIFRQVYKSQTSKEGSPVAVFEGAEKELIGNKIFDPIVRIREAPVCVDCREKADNANKYNGVHISYSLYDGYGR